MSKRLTSLSFIIGLFFVLIALILLAGYFISSSLHAIINLYAGVVFTVFGVFMTVITPHEKTID